jgi:peptidoglycan/LPS O-acetylase OafA/YrhL
MADFMMNNGRLGKDAELWIDALRGVAALMVLLSHGFELAVAEKYGWDPHETPGIWRFAKASLGNGDFWVWLFFVISGLCIHRSIVGTLQDGNFRWWRYIVARVTRIYPLFLLGLLLALVAWSMHLDFATDAYNPAPWPQLISSLFNLQLLTAPFPAFGPSWSLTCEIMYYAAWPMALILCKGRIGRAIGLSLGGAFFVLACILFLWKGLHRLESSAAVNGLWTITVLFPVWIAGAWLGASWDYLAARITKQLWIMAFGLCALFMSLEWILRFKDYPVWDRHFVSWGATVGLVCVLAGARHARLSAHPQAQAGCRWLGAFSYPCYILHIPLLLILNSKGDALFSEFLKNHPAWLTFGEILGVVLILGLVGPSLERFAMRWRSELMAGI